MKYLGHVCKKNPDHGNERYRYGSGRTRCVQCAILTVYEYRRTSKKAAENLRRARSSEKYKKNAAQWRRCATLRRKIKEATTEKRAAEILAKMQTMDGWAAREAYLRQQLSAIKLESYTDELTGMGIATG